MNLPNIITLCRFLLIPIYIYFFGKGHILAALFIFIVAGISDVLDGYLARKNGQVTPLGALLDPLADKMMLIVVFVSLLTTHHLPWEAAIVILIRELGMIVGSAIFHFRGFRTVPANMMGKITTVLFYLAITLLILDTDYAKAYLWFAIVISIITTTIYISKFVALNRVK